MEQAKERHVPLPSDPIVIEESPTGPVPFMTRFAKRPDLKVTPQMGNQTPIGTTKGTMPSPGTEWDWANDDQ